MEMTEKPEWKIKAHTLLDYLFSQRRENWKNIRALANAIEQEDEALCDAFHSEMGIPRKCL